MLGRVFRSWLARARPRRLRGFRTAKQQKEILQKVKEGNLDILIGTHRLVSKDIQFKDLGLLIVDEEQRFGVKQKEKIKGIKKNVDVLTLSATPIPRTLHMSLSGVRDISVIETPPEERYPVQTYVVEQNDQLIRDAILREIGRGGQVYFVYNRVEDIERMAKYVQSLVRIKAQMGIDY
ncbi:DEAD/DEAH box helicase [Bradyrhizobium sp. WBOS08]|uniref:DEAD/DEAH box helicase n=1 Tax=Bradyrhizobium sp. WBOS08 TaxID=2171500 RepID=UPI00359CA561